MRITEDKIVFFITTATFIYIFLCKVMPELLNFNVVMPKYHNNNHIRLIRQKKKLTHRLGTGTYARVY